MTCNSCRARYPLKNGILHCFPKPNFSDTKREKDVTEEIKAFYEGTPFPDYSEIGSIDSLRQKTQQTVFAGMLDSQLPRNIDILECGCGTGQMTNFLAAGGRNVYGTDISLSSLGLAEGFRERNSIERSGFIQMNLFRPCFGQFTFDLVICNGVLHHTSDPRGGFESIVRLVKPGGFILVGLYHRYSRITTDIRRAIFRLTKGSFKFLDPQYKILQGKQWESWYMDQYMNPHESKHTIHEVMEWCRNSGLTVVNTIPKTIIGGALRSDEQLFSKAEIGSRLETFMTEFSKLWRGSSEGGLFIVIAKRT